MKLLSAVSALLLLNEAKSQLECPNSIDLEAWTEEVLNDGELIFKYSVVLSPDGPASSIFCGRLESNSESWVAFGISPEGTMAGGDGIIGTPDDGMVQKYTLGNGPRIELMPADKQTLMSTSLIQENGQTIMEFAKYLVEEGENEITSDGENTFLWAIGSSNSVGYHGSANRDDFDVNIKATPAAATTPAPSPGGTGSGEVSTGSVKTLAPTSGMARDDPPPTDTAPVPPPETLEPVPAPTPTPPTSSGVMARQFAMILGAGVAALWFGM